MRLLVSSSWAVCGVCLTLGWPLGLPGVAVAQTREPAGVGAGLTPAMAVTAEGTAETTLRVCADPHSMPQSNDRGEGYENKIAAALAHDLGKKISYTYFPQRMGFVRNTLRARDEQTQQFKCDLIVGVPKGYELTATTKPYMHSIYALVMPARAEFNDLKSAEDLLRLPPARLHSLRVGLFAKTPASDWVLKNGLIDHAVSYPAQSGDPNETPDSVIEHDLEDGKIDVAVVWGPIAGFIVSRHTEGKDRLISVPFKPDPTIRFDYEISMGVRQGEKDFQNTLDTWIAGHQAQITQILTAYHIPLLAESPSPPG
jgi:quinoprotein dehydrogenase-associated probable ABC transporter substrate-binding protein